MRLRRRRLCGDGKVIFEVGGIGFAEKVNFLR